MKCPKCGAENPPKNKFCGECGCSLKKLSTEDRMDLVKKHIPESLVQKILLTKDTIKKERKDVTVIFADISGFTSMSESLDPEELTLIMNDCFRKLSIMVYRYEGIIDKFIGDCIMAIFGAPVTHEDDPERAILACLDMQLALNEINKNFKKAFKKLEIHSGVNTGQVIAGKIGSDLQMDYTVMGDTVNVAQRLKDIASPGSILVGSETYNRARHAFDFMPIEPVQLKGKAKTVRSNEVIGKKWGSEYGLTAIRSDLIGRDQEFSRLKQGYNDLANNKTGIYILKGEIGVGKSRLLYEFKKFLTISAPDISLIDGRGVSYESSIPYKSFADSLRHFLLAEESRITAGSDKIIKEKIESYLDDETDDVAPYIYKLLNIELSDKQLEKTRYLDSHSLQLQIFLAIATLFERILDKTGVIFIIDDLQWVDSASLEVINFILPLVKQKNMSFYLSYRFGDLSPIKKLLNTIQHEFVDFNIEINLSNLKPEDSSQLISNLIGTEISDKLKKYIIAKSGGNPFFIEEIVRNIVESGMLAKEERITEEDIQMPGSVEAAVSSRIDTLNKEAKYLLKIASIIGRSFPKTLLEEVVKEKDIYQHIDELETSEFIVRINKDNKLFYAFRHALFHEVAYNSLLKSERTIYHKVIAETIENKFKGEIDGYFATLAHHYYNCKNSEKTMEYSLKAGDEAAALYANEEALMHYNRALSVADNDTTKATVFEKIANIESLIGRNDEALKYYQDAQNSTKDKLVKARIGARIAHLLTQTGKIDKGLELLKRTRIGIQENDTDVLADINYHLAHDLVEFKAETEQAEKLVNEGIRISKKIKDVKSEACGLRMKSHILWRRGMGDKALKVLKESQKLYESLGDQRILCEIYTLMGAVSRSINNLNMAIDYVKKSLNISQKIGHKLLLGNAYNNLGVYYGIMGENKIAINYYKKNLDIKQKVGDKRGEAIVLFNIGVLKYDIGELDASLDYFTKAIEIFESVNDIRSMVYVYSTIANILADKGEESRAVEYYEKALKLAQKTEDKILLSGIYCHYAKYFLSIDNVEKALELLERAEGIIVQSGNQTDLAKLFRDFAEAYIKNKDPKAIKYAEDALKLAIEAKVKRDEIEALKILGKAQTLISGNFDEGIRNIKRSIAIAKEINLVVNTADGLFALGEALIANNKYEKALEYLNQAKKIYTKANAQFSLRKVESLIKSIS